MCNPKDFAPRDTITLAALAIEAGKVEAEWSRQTRPGQPLEDRAARVDDVARAIDLIAPDWTVYQWGESIRVIARALVNGEPMDPRAIEARLVRR